MYMADDWFNTFNSYFFLSLGAIVVGCIHFGIRSCERSRCLTLKCCGLSIMERTLADENVLPLIRTETLSV